MRKTPNEILYAKDDERHDWLITATGDEIYAFLRLIKTDISWAQHGRDALNVALARENMELQKDIKNMTGKMKKMTAWVTGLTVIIAILTLIQAYPIIKTFFNCAKTSIDIQKPENTTNQSTETNQIKTKNDNTLNKTKILNHK